MKMDYYEINADTIMIEPVSYGEKIYSKVTETNAEFIFPETPLNLIEYSCLYFGSSYQGRVAGTQKLLNASHKVPIMIESSLSLFAFPTTSITRRECCWVFFEHVKDIRSDDFNQSVVIFQNNKTRKVDVSLSVLKNQLLRTALLKSKVQHHLRAHKISHPFPDGATVADTVLGNYF